MTADTPAQKPARPLRALLIEDSLDDAELNVLALRRAGYDPTVVRVETRAAAEKELRTGRWEVVLCDYALPTFDAPSALALVHELDLDIPFIVVSGTVGESAAVDVMRAGAHDYVVKGALLRLGPVIERELRNAVSRRERREAEEQVRRSEERHRLLVEHSSDVVTIVDKDGRAHYISPAIERLLGYRPEELLGQDLTPLVHPDDRALAGMVPDAADTILGPTRTIHVKALHKDGSVRFLESIVSQHLETAAIVGTIITTRDISQRHAVEDERRARLQAELASQTKSSFLANMSHELRTPLNAIIGFSELMEQGMAGPLSARQTTYVANVLQAGRHLLNLVNDILDLSKIEAGKLDLNREWAALGAIAEGVEHGTRPLAEARGVTLEVAIPATLPLIYVDPVRLKQILYNLVSNGIKFTPAGGAVRVVARGDDQAVRLDVEDTGVGIRPEDVPRLFKEFEQLEPTGMAVKPEGTGLGLALTRRLVEMHGGTISVTSKLGEGSTFAVVLPGVRKPEAPRSSDPPPPSDGGGATRILVVDDDAGAASLIAGHVRAAGLEVLFARTADEALRLAATERPAAITLDLLMPNIDGWATLGCLKQDAATADIPVVIVSVNDDAPRGRALGAARHLTKPVARSTLHEALESVGVPVLSIAGHRVLVVGGARLDGVAESLVEAGCRVDRAPSFAPSAVLDDGLALAIVDLAERDVDPDSILERSTSSIPVLGIVDAIPSTPQPHVSYFQREAAVGPEALLRRIHESIRPRPVPEASSNAPHAARGASPADRSR
ncbi:MAG: response regulator [Labilithrix sp.]|nr:response regulator [Labilithrix sp.]